MKLRLTENGPQVDQATPLEKQQQEAQQPVERSYDVKELNEHLKALAKGALPDHVSRSIQQKLDETPASAETPILTWEKTGANRWRDPNVSPELQPQPVELTREQKLENYRQAVIEAVAFYKKEVSDHREHSKNGHMNSKFPQDGPQQPQNPGSALVEKKRMDSMAHQVNSIEALTKKVIPVEKEAEFKKAINDRLDTLMQLFPTGRRPDVERLRNLDNIRPRQPHQELSKDKEGLYWLTDPESLNQKTKANGPYVFVVPASNPSQVWIGERANGGHTAISRGGDVYYAGEIEFKDGQIVKWNNESGHYQPKPELHRQIGSTSIAMLETLLPRDKFVPFK